MDKFAIGVNFVLLAEGGYVNNKNDPGGETNFGLSDRGDGTIDGKYKGIPIKELTRQGAVSAYQQEYWIPAGCEGKPWEMAMCLFDTAVNMGVGTAKKLEQASEGDWIKYLQLRAIRYQQLIDKNPKLSVFKNGWLNRVNKLKTFILSHQADFPAGS